MSEFIHLHNHTHYSLQDGACTVDHLINAALKHKMHSVALTDHGVMYGAIEFYKKASKKGLKPILGMEAYIVRNGNRFERGSSDQANGRKKSKNYFHLILLAKNQTGYKNLVKLSSLGHTEGFYYKPRVDLELLKQHSEGLICTSACAGGIVSSHIINGDYEKARESAITYKEIFGDDFYLEIQNHFNDFDEIVLEQVPKLANDLGIKLVATNDCHYIEKEHAVAHNILLHLSDKTGEVDYHALRYKTPEFYFKSQDEMIKLFKKYKGAIENTLEIESKIELNFDFKGHHFPQFPIPSDSPAKTLDEYFEFLAKQGLEKKFETITKEIRERFDFELETIKQMGFSGYFLIVQDFITAAKERNIPVGPGRGSVAGSLIAYCLGITTIEPLKYNLLFERFLNPARHSMPDIDVDFADDQRGIIIDYVREKYGAHCVSQIVTFNSLSSKAVIRDVARVLKIPIPTVNKITKFIPSKFGKVYTIEQSLKEVPELRWVKDSKENEIQELIRYAKVLEGMFRNASKHAAGVVITPSQVSDYVPLANAVQQTDIVTQYNMKDLEHVGLLKMDFLGLRTLTIIRDTVSLIKRNHGVDVIIDEIPFDDEKTFRIFAKGQTTGVFQFESPPMREYLKKLKPTSINDLAAMNALYRPGPMEYINEFIDRKYGRSPVEYDHNILEPILKETYGIIVYQEQVIQIANIVGGMSLAEADNLRRAMGKKDLLAMKEQKEKFILGAKEKGISQKVANSIFESIDKFANYGFNKSHAVAYSFVAYQTAYLKAHYTAEFLAANLTNEFGNTNKVTNFLEECRKLRIEVLYPDINNPSVFFDVKDDKIRFGLSAIKNVGVSAVEEIIRCKNELGRDFTSIFDFCSAVDLRIVNKRAFEGLILAGAFDLLHKNRSQLFNYVEMIIDFGHKAQNSKLTGQDSLFGDTVDVKIAEPELPPIHFWSEKDKLAREREVLGFYLTGHPLRKYELEYRSFATVHLGETEVLEEENTIRACGVVTALKTKIDKAGKTMAFFTLDDLSGSCECLMFSKIYEKCGEFVKEEEPIMILGKTESSGDAIKIHIDEVIPLDKCRDRFTQSLVISFDSDKDETEAISSLKKIFEKFPGKTPVIIQLQNNGDKVRKFYIKSHRVLIDNKFLESLYELFSEDSVTLSS